MFAMPAAWSIVCLARRCSGQASNFDQARQLHGRSVGNRHFFTDFLLSVEMLWMISILESEI